MKSDSICDESDKDLARQFDIFNVPDGYIEDPYPWFRRLRDHDPVHRNADGSILLTRYEDVRLVWRDLTCVVDRRDQFKRKFGEGPLLEHHTTSMLFRDPPDHNRLRQIVNPYFDVRSIGRLRPAAVSIVERLLASIEDGQVLDFRGEFAFQLTIEVICEMLGVPREDGERIQGYGKRLINPLNPMVSAEEIADGHLAVTQFKDYLIEHINRVRAQKDIDATANVISALVSAERNGAPVSENDIIHMCILLLNGGHEAVSNFIAWSIHYMIEFPEAMEYFRLRGDDVGVAIDELLRFTSPLQLQGRRTTRELQLHGVTIPPETEIVFSVGAANRDERAFVDPDRLVLDRHPNPHLAFGAGVHICIGQTLARMHSGVALPMFLRTFRKIERAGPAEIAPSVRFRGLQRLPIRVAR